MLLTSCLSLVPVITQYGWSQPTLRCGGGRIRNSVTYRAEKHALTEEDFPAHRRYREMTLNHIAQHTPGLPRVCWIDRS